LRRAGAASTSPTAVEMDYGRFIAFGEEIGGGAQVRAHFEAIDLMNIEFTHWFGTHVFLVLLLCCAFYFF